MKRTDLEGLGELLPVRLRKDEDDGFCGRLSFARAKSGDRTVSLGRDVEEGDLEGKPRNWDVRSSNWVRRRSAWS